MYGRRQQRSALVLALLMFFSTALMFESGTGSFSVNESEDLVLAQPYSPVNSRTPILVAGLPPLMCGTTVCETPLRNPIVPDGTWTHEEPNWWFRYGPDLDWNGMDDRLQYILADVYESQSPTAIIADDGRLTVAIVIDFAWHPEERELDQVREILNSHGWVGEEGDARFFTVGEIDSIIVDKVPQSALMELYHLEGVVVIEQQNVMVPTMSVASRAVKARSSETYTSTADMMGVRGDGVVIAILDSGVDNEHRSLNDFDDVNDEPDADANSYDDQKWLAGFDSTDSLNSQTSDGSIDPDDTAGHGSHVAGIAIGTGDASRNHVGIAPGAYLVDVKVFTDIGRSNSQYTISGMNWTINNKNTDWGNNASSNGIDIMSMSFGRARSPVGGQDTGDNGSDAEARLVNDAWDAGIVPVCAMGNDGANYVASPASADRCIAVAASDDVDTVVRGDDIVADYSNWGPRQDDGDSDSWDELKPDVIAPGTNIFSVQHAASGPIGGAVLADDSYTEMSGTSMSTPVVSGLCALILQANPGYEPADVKSALQNYSEFVVDEITSINGQSWNASEGFGRVDAMQLLEQSGGGGGGGGGGDDGGRWVTLDLPLNGTWMDVGETYRFRGDASIPEGEKYDSNNTIEAVKVSARYTFSGSGGLNNRTAFSWMNATGIDNWTFDLAPELWHDGAGLYVEVRALDNIGRWSEPAWAEYKIGQSSLTLVEPSGHGSVSGDVQFSGEYKAVLGEAIQYRIGESGEWQTAVDNLAYPYVCEQADIDDCSPRSWSAIWDSTEVQDGGWVLYTRLLAEGGWTSTPIERYIFVDNVPAASDLEPIGNVEVYENGIPVASSFVDAFLNVAVTIRNSGDAHARNFDVTLLEDGSQVATQSINKLESTKSLNLLLGYHPSTTGNHDLEVRIDPANEEEESREDNNVASLNFAVNNRPAGVDLAIRQGAAKTNPPIANPNGDVTLNIRVENLAADGASGATFTLEMWSDLGWEALEQGRSLNIISGAGYIDVPFTLHEGTFDEGTSKFRATIAYDGGIDIEMDNNQIEFTILSDESQLQGARSLDLPDGHEVLGFYGKGGENLLFTGEGSSIWIHRINEKYDLITCLEFEDDWAGEFSIAEGESSSAYVTWTRRYTDDFGVTLSTLSFSSIDLSCTATNSIDLMEPLMLAEGTYWGIDISVKGGQALVGGYHRDLFTNGTHDDITSIFLATAESPLDFSSWELTEDVIPELEPPLGQIGKVQVGGGEEWTHITYQATRDDETAIERVGTFYAHGRLGTSNWSFRKAIGDETSLGEMMILSDDGEDIVVTAWRQGTGQASTLVVTRSTPSMQEQDIRQIPAPGLDGLIFIESDRGIQMFHDSVGPSGRQIVYSIISTNQTMVGTPIGEGDLVYGGRSDSVGETHLFYLSPTGDWRARMIIDDGYASSSNNGILDTLRLWTGLDERTFDLAWKLAVLVCSVGCLLMFFASAGIITHKRRKGPSLTVEIEDDDEILDVDEDYVQLLDEKPTMGVEMVTDIPAVAIETPTPGNLSDDENGEEAEEIVETVDVEGGPSSRRKRREARVAELEPKIEVQTLPSGPVLTNLAALPPPPTPTELGALPPPPGRDVSCECGATFRIKTLELKRVECPVCFERINL